MRGSDPLSGCTVPAIFARRAAGSGGIVDWHFHPGDKTRVLLRSPEQLQSLLKNIPPSVPIAASGQESHSIDPSSENPGVGGSIPPLATFAQTPHVAVTYGSLRGFCAYREFSVLSDSRPRDSPFQSESPARSQFRGSRCGLGCWPGGVR